MSWTAGIGRSQFDHRASIVFHDADSLRERLSKLAGSKAGEVPAAASRVKFVYTGQGGQWIGMGRALYEREPVVRAVLDRCDELLREDRGVSLLEVMFG